MTCQMAITQADRNDEGCSATQKLASLRSGQRMRELRAAHTLADMSHLPPARCHELKGDRKGQFSVDLQHPYRLLFVPANNPIPTKADGGLDWAGVTEIEIIEIVDTH